MEKRRPLLSIRPHFDTALAVVHALIAMAVGFLPCTMIAGTVIYLLLNLVGLGRFVSAGGIYSFFLVISIVGLPAFYFEIRKRAYQRTVYNFYDEYIDFQYFHFFINRRRGRVRYEDVSDITQQATFLQEQRRLTNIYIYVPSLDYMRQRGIPGMILPDLQLSRGYMNQIMNLFEAPEELATSEPAAPETKPSEASPVPASAPETAATPAASTGDGK